VSLFKVDPRDRLFNIRKTLVELQSQLDSKRNSLAEDAVYLDDEKAAAPLRAEIQRLAGRVEELKLALPVAERKVREQEAEEKASEEKRAAEEVAALRQKRIAAAGRLDDALKVLGAALQNYLALPGPQRSVRSYMAGAVGLLAPDVLRVLQVPGVEKTFRVPLAEYEERRGDTLDPNKVGLAAQQVAPAAEDA